MSDLVGEAPAWSEPDETLADHVRSQHAAAQAPGRLGAKVLVRIDLPTLGRRSLLSMTALPEVVFCSSHTHVAAGLTKINAPFLTRLKDGQIPSHRAMGVGGWRVALAVRRTWTHSQDRIGEVEESECLPERLCANPIVS